MLLCSCVYLGLGFFEPSHSRQHEYSESASDAKIKTLKTIESVLLLVIWFDLFLTRCHKLNDKKKSKWKLLFSRRNILQYLLYILFTLDAILFWTTYPQIMIRFGRYFRPSSNFTYSERSLISKFTE